MHSLLEIIQKTTDFLAKRGVESARLNAELLAGHVLGLERMQLYLQFERPITEVELAALRPLIKRRGDREPLQYVVGQVEFCDLRLQVDRRALIPRPETELLVQIVQKARTEPPRRILDLGTGTGALALALAQLWPGAAVVATDVSKDALALAATNTAANGLDGRVRLIESDWLASPEIGGDFELIVANPPYLSADEVAAAQPEVRDHEPRQALTPGPGGMEALAVILREAKSRLAPGGLLACETGIAQHAALRAEADRCGYARVESRTDLTGRDRYLLAFV